MKRLCNALLKVAILGSISFLWPLISEHGSAFGQAITTSRMTGTVVDFQGLGIGQAQIVVKSEETGTEYRTVSNEQGGWVIPSVPAGRYTVTITAPNFKTVVIREVKVDVGTPATVKANLEVGEISDQVIVTGGGEVLQSQTATVATTITGRQINELPFVARDAVQLVLTQPGVSTPGTPRTSSINGLPKGSINMTLDGVNIQDNLLKSSDGFFATVQPKSDAVEEVTISTATPGAESGGEGAVQVKFVTRSGTNQIHGGGFWQHRNTALNSNFYFNNLNGLPREKVLLNQYGGHVGGPILKDKLFYFFNYEGFRLPQTFSRVGLFGTPVTVLSPSAQQGLFTYRDSRGGVRSINLYTLAANANAVNSTLNLPTTPDPILMNVLTRGYQLSAANGRVTDRIASDGDYNRLNVDFQGPAQNKREFLTGHLDYNLSSKHHFDAVYNYQYYDSRPDNVNNQFQAYPGTGTVLGSDVLGSVHRNTFSLVGALRSSLTAGITNEVRFGISGGGQTQFAKELTPDLFAELGGAALVLGNNSPGTGTAYLTAPQNRTTFSTRNSPVWQFSDNLTWSKGQHTLGFGVQYTRINLWQKGFGRQLIPQITFGVVSTDSAFTTLFTPANFPDSTATDRANASLLYSVLVGRISQISRSVSLDEKTKTYGPIPFIERDRQQEYGFYAADSWRFRPNLTLNFGVRWQIEPSTRNLNGVYTRSTLADVYGVSGAGNLFKPGVFEGSQPRYEMIDAETSAYPTRYRQFAPSFGFAYSFGGQKHGRILSGLFGKEGQTVIRAGYSMAYVREGLNTYVAIYGSNQGGTVSTTVDAATSPEEFNQKAPNFRGPLPSRPPIFSALAGPGVSVNAFDPNLKPGYVQSWTFGVQRELTKDMVFEARYVGNHGTRLWRQVDLNQVDIYSNGFIDDFKQAAANQAICRANAAACKAAQGAAGTELAYGNYGLPGQRPTLIQTAVNSGADANFINWVQRGEVARVAQNIAFNATRMNRLIAAGRVPWVIQADGAKVSNYFIANPSIGNGGAFLMTNGTDTNYHGLQLELRRRLSKGLLVQGSYVFSKAISNTYNSSNSVLSQPVDLRDPDASRTVSPWDLRQAFKVNWIYELPIGKGRRFSFNGEGFGNKFVNTVFGGWQFNGVTRIQSGTPFLLRGDRQTATANDRTTNTVSADNGVVLRNLTRRQLQDLVKIRHLGNEVFWLPQDLVLNTQAAFEVGGRNQSQLNPNEAYIGPPAAGQLGERIVLYGPRFTRFDLGFLRRFKVSESKEFQFRVTMLNAFNHINFFITSPGNDSSTLAITSTNPAFGRTTNAYRDSTVSGTNDPGGRLIEFQLRFNF